MRGCGRGFGRVETVRHRSSSGFQSDNEQGPDSRPRKRREQDVSWASDNVIPYRKGQAFKAWAWIMLGGAVVGGNLIAESAGYGTVVGLVTFSVTWIFWWRRRTR